MIVTRHLPPLIVIRVNTLNNQEENSLVCDEAGGGASVLQALTVVLFFFLSLSILTSRLPLASTELLAHDAIPHPCYSLGFPANRSAAVGGYAVGSCL